MKRLQFLFLCVVNLVFSVNSEAQSARAISDEKIAKKTLSDLKKIEKSFAELSASNNAQKMIGLSASTLPNNANNLISESKVAKKNFEKNYYFGQHDLCESEIIKAEKKYGIPSRLLLAIATIESGRSDGKSKRAWPWTICANGRGYYCSTKSAAIATTKKLISRGIRNIDVGCMQVNLMHPSKAFKNLEEAFTPRANIDYAAKFFLSLKNMYSSWTHAVGYYHSKISKHYKPYCSMVYNAWTKARNIQVKESPRIERAASTVKSNISFLPSYYSLVDNGISAKLHQLGKKTLVRGVPKFFTKKLNKLY